ncbi:MAG: carbohydrate kinase family protein [Candidatus Sulfotelmatobacter sp.]
MIEVCVVGELNLDLILYGFPGQLSPDVELLANGMTFTLGSSSAIFAHNLCALGTDVGFVSMIGSDPLGKLALERLSAIGVDTTRVKQGGDTPTGLTVVLPVTQGQGQHRYMLTYPGTMFEMQYSDVDMKYLLGAHHFHLSSFFLHRALRPQIMNLFRQAKEAGLTTSLDTNDDPEDHWGIGPGGSELHDLLKCVDVFLPNEREAKKIAGTTDLARALNVLAKLSKVVAVKCGAGLSVCRSGDEQWSLPPPRVDFVDDVGAGDTFAAGFIHLYLRGGKLEDCLAFANTAAAYSVTKAGGSEAFRDRGQWSTFLRQQWSSMGRGTTPWKD